MSRAFPTDIPSIANWSVEHGVNIADARTRFVQFSILAGIAMEPHLRNACVFKGGNALDFVLLPNRSTIDLDFSLDMEIGKELGSDQLLKPLLVRAMSRTSPRTQLVLKVQGVRNRPSGEGRTRATIQATIGYAFPDQQGLVARMQRGLPSSQVVPVEVSLNEAIVEFADMRLADGIPALRIASTNDIAAEKLRALLQQPIRRRHRPQDVLDLAVIIGSNVSLDRATISRALLLKAEARNVPVSVQAFHHPEIADRARIGYALLEPNARMTFIPFEEAFASVLAFVATLDIPPG